MKPESEQRVLEFIEKNRSKIVEFLRTLVSIPSVTGEELEIQKFIEGKLKTLGLRNSI